MVANNPTALFSGERCELSAFYFYSCFQVLKTCSLSCCHPKFSPWFFIELIMKYVDVAHNICIAPMHLPHRSEACLKRFLKHCSALVFTFIFSLCRIETVGLGK